ncbi:AT-rich interactive domain-containing protein [Drosera capensis]
MFQSQGASKQSCSILAVVCSASKWGHEDEDGHRLRYPFPELSSSGRLEVKMLNSPSVDEFRRTLESMRPNVVYLQGELLPNNEVGSLNWGGVDISNAEGVSVFFGSTLPTVVYLEISSGEKLAEALYSEGIPYVIFWKSAISLYAASHFRLALFSAIQSSPCHTWDAFQLAQASFRLYCIRNNFVLPARSLKAGDTMGPCLLGESPIIDVALPEADAENNEDNSDENLSAINIHEDAVAVRILVCGSPCTPDAFLLGCLEDGLHALLSIEMRGSKLHNRYSAPPPPLQAGTFSRGVLTMRCDLSTSSFAHISLLVSGSAQTCFYDQAISSCHLLENHIKKEVTERSQLVYAIPASDDNMPASSEPRKSDSIACGASVFEVCMKMPTWALQVLRQLAPEASYRSFVALGIASIHGTAVASFEEDDADRLMFLCTRRENDLELQNPDVTPVPSWLRPPAPSRKRSFPGQASSTWGSNQNPENQAAPRTIYAGVKPSKLPNGSSSMVLPTRQYLKMAAMRPIRHCHLRKILPFTGTTQADGLEGGYQTKLNLPPAPSTRHITSNPAPYRKSSSTSYQAKQIISLNPIPLKKHGCGRAPIQLCPEEEFLRDVMQFLILRGHTRLIPQGGFAEFPDAILNSKRLDLYNLYREVVSRGGFHVGNGINWKGQVFSKMRNYTATNRMTGVGNTLKRHYETYLLEYELAHDDVDGECCLLCHSSAAGDWVNCGICGEWAHFGCDRRQGLGAFKDYAKTDGLEYICPNCSVTNFKKKMQKPANGFTEGLTYS